MTEVIFLGLGLLVGASLAWSVGTKRGARETRDQLASFLQGLRVGNIPDPARTSSTEIPEIRTFREVLSSGWVPRPPDDTDEPRRALGRIALYLRHRIEAPLLAGLDGGSMALQDAADEALAAVEDLEFFLEDPPGPNEPEVRNLSQLVQEVTREFAGQSPVMVRVRSPESPIRVSVEPEPLKDALFLVLHNAGEFGQGQPVEIELGVGGVRPSFGSGIKGPGSRRRPSWKRWIPSTVPHPEGWVWGSPMPAGPSTARAGRCS